MAEETGAALGQRPVAVARPEGGEFATGEPGAHADGGVVAGDGVTADEGKQLRAKQRPWAASWFDGDESIGLFRDFGE